MACLQLSQTPACAQGTIRQDEALHGASGQRWAPPKRAAAAEVVLCSNCKPLQPRAVTSYVNCSPG